jgi:hypothetical protein
MIQFKEEEVCQILKALTHYRDEVTGHDDIWDRYDRLVTKMDKYGEEVSPTSLSCTNTK